MLIVNEKKLNDLKNNNKFYIRSSLTFSQNTSKTKCFLHMAISIAIISKQSFDSQNAEDGLDFAWFLSNA